MAYIGKVPTAVPLSTNDLADNIVTVDKLATTLDLSGNTITLPSGVGGKVLQVVQGSTSTEVQIFGSSLQSLGLSANITPSSTSSKILISTSIIGYQRAETTSDVNAYGGIRRDSTLIHSAQTIQRDANDTSKDNMFFTLNMEYLDSPSTTSQITYSARAGSDNFVLFSIGGGNNSTQTITLMEIAG